MFKKRIKNLYLQRRILWDIAVKQLKAKYAGSVLGVWLAIINPLLVMLAVTFVFNVIFKLEIENFFLFALAGIFPWLFSSNALCEAAASIVNQQNILRQFNLPREIIPLSSILANFLNFIISWCVIYPLFLFFNSKIIILLPLLAVILVLNFFFICGVGLVLSVLNVFFRDLSHLIGTLLMFWFWVTPVFYSLNMVPEKFRWIYNFNPMAPFIAGYRSVIYAGHLPGFFIFISMFFWVVLSLGSALIFFSYAESKLLKRI
ncbi:MAG: ABC transporter permease [Candidatus Omnitrophota bacterium]